MENIRKRMDEADAKEIADWDKAMTRELFQRILNCIPALSYIREKPREDDVGFEGEEAWFEGMGVFEIISFVPERATLLDIDSAFISEGVDIFTNDCEHHPGYTAESGPTIAIHFERLKVETRLKMGEKNWVVTARYDWYSHN